jgi:hypothetical protein
MKQAITLRYCDKVTLELERICAYASAIEMASDVLSGSGPSEECARIVLAYFPQMVTRDIEAVRQDLSAHSKTSEPGRGAELEAAP